MHGGDIYRNEVKIDFSVNTNPAGMPQEMRDALLTAMDHLAEYPDPYETAMREGIAEQLNASEPLKPAEESRILPEWIIPGNGASEIFLAIRHALEPERIFLTAPSFSGYAYVSEGLAVTRHFLKEENGFRPDEALAEDLRKFGRDGAAERLLAFLACPNNPNGAMIALPLLSKILAVCEEEGIYLVLDECFVDFCKDAEAYHAFMRTHHFPHLIRVGAYTKIYSIPGVRLGYGIIEDETLREKVKKQLPEWNTSAFAQAAGSCRFDFASFKEETRRTVQKERTFLAAGLEKAGMKVFPSDTNYLMIKTEQPLYEQLLAKKILIRNCEDYPGLGKGFYRVAVRSREENESLLAAMTE